MANGASRSSDRAAARPGISSSIDELLAGALERGGQSLQTGRSIVTFAPHALADGLRSLGRLSVRMADARDFTDQRVALDDAGDADGVMFPEVGAAVIGAALAERGLGALVSDTDSGIEAIEPEYFAFPQGDGGSYLRGFVRAVQAIAADLGTSDDRESQRDVDAQVLGATWGLIKCQVPPSAQSGANIKVAILDGGLDLGHPDFAGRPIVAQSFVGGPVQSLVGHAMHITGTACGPKAPAGTTPRYGIGYKTLIHIGKVLTDTGAGTTATVLAGLNWAIANRCPVILLAIGSAAPPQAAYTAAGTAALNKGCLVVAAAGHSAGPVGAPANSPTIMSVASLDQTLIPSAFSNFGKIEIAAPGRDIFSSVPRPVLYATYSGTSMAAAHVAGCAALWAQSSPTLRGTSLWKKLQTTAKHLPFPPAKVGAGLVQAP